MEKPTEKDRPIFGTVDAGTFFHAAATLITVKARMSAEGRLPAGIKEPSAEAAAWAKDYLNEDKK